MPSCPSRHSVLAISIFMLASLTGCPSKAPVSEAASQSSSSSPQSGTPVGGGSAASTPTATPTPGPVYPAPTITKVSTANAVVTVEGTGFLPGLKIFIGKNACTGVVVVSSTSATCTAPAGGPGQVNVTVGNSDTQTAVLANAFTYGTPNSWLTSATAGAPGGRQDAAMVWTGEEILVWGGVQGFDSQGTGGRYDPATNTWKPMSTTGAPSARSAVGVWTGTRLIVWGGLTYASGFPTHDDGGLYDPKTDTWAPMTNVGAPAARHDNVAVWSGTRLFVWGGAGAGAGGGFRNDGGVYDPTTNTWKAISTTNAPSIRQNAAGVWTGNRLIVWGGIAASDVQRGGIYDPATDTWKPTSTTNAPVPSVVQHAFWSGTKLLVWGSPSYTNPNDRMSGIYDPATDSWAPMNEGGGPPKFTWNARAIWTGTRLVVWGGSIETGTVHSPQDTGFAYNPATDGWTALTTKNAPAARVSHHMTWASGGIFVWGGNSGAGNIATGGFYIP